MWSVINYIWEVMAPKTTFDVVMGSALLLVALLSVGYLINNDIRTRSAKRAQLRKKQRYAFERQERSVVDAARFFEGQSQGEDQDVII